MIKSIHSPVLAFLAIFATSLVLVYFAFTTPVGATQTVPYKMNFQGLLKDSGSMLKADGTYNMKFRIYDASSGGTLVWSEERSVYGSSGVVLVGGLFSTQLGDVVALDPADFTDPDLYFEIELPTPATATCATNGCAVYTEGPMTPRNKLGASAYALNSDTVDGIDGANLGQLNVNNVWTGTNLVRLASTTALSVQNGSSVAVLAVDTTNGEVELGAATLAGKLVVSDGSSNTVTLSVNALAGNYTLAIPTITANDTLCLLTLGNCGVKAIGTLDGGTANATGATIASNTLYLQSASATYSGLVNTTTQTLAGAKTFSTSLAITGGTNYGSYYRDASGNVVTTAAGTTGQCLVATTSSNPTWGACTSGNIAQVPATTAQNTITPTVASVVGLTVNGTSSTAATAVNILQGGAATALAVTSSKTGTGQSITLSNTTGTQTNGLLVNRTGAGGTTTSLVNLTNTAGTATNALTFTGTYTKLINSTNFNVTNAGALTAVGLNAGTGLLQGALGLTVTGAIANINASSNFATNINTGNSTGAVNIGSSTTGAIALQSASTVGVTGTTTINGLAAGTATALTVNNSTSTGSIFVAQDGGVAVMTIAEGGAITAKNTANSVTAFQVQNAAGVIALAVDTTNGEVELGAATLAGKLVVSDGSSNTVTLSVDALAGNYTLAIPTITANDTLCLLTLGNCGVKAIGALDGGTANATGATIASNTLYLQSASATYSGLVNTTTQTFVGDKTFKSASNSTSAFQVQNSSSVALFTVDTTNARLYVGPTAGDTVGTLLVVGNKTSEGDPTGVEGAMYYNSSMKSFRCYRDDAWLDCGVRNIEREWLIEDEFMSGRDVDLNSYAKGYKAVETFGVNAWCWTKIGTGGSSGIVQNGDLVGYDHPGTLEFDSSDTNVGVAVSLDSCFDGSMPTVKNTTYKTNVAADIVTEGNGAVFNAGIFDWDGSDAGATPTTGVWWRYSSANTYWKYCYHNGTAEQCADSNVTTASISATNFVRIEIRVGNASPSGGTSNMTFLINGNSYSLSGKNIRLTDGSGSLAPAYTFWSTNSNRKVFGVDYLQIRGVSDAAR